MESTVAAEPEDTGAYYSPDDLCGIFRRLLILVVDLTIVLLIWVTLLVLSGALGASTPLPGSLAAFGLAWAYLAGLKAGPRGTLGYRLAGVQLVNLQGRPAGLLVSTYRFLLMLLGPFHLAVDLLWLAGDPNGQTLRDKLTGTYVVRRNARPIGHARLSHPTYFIATLAFALPEVNRPDSKPR